MNADFVIENLVADEVKTVDGIDFHIQRYYKDDHIFKEISFEDEGKNYHFTERVQAFD